MRKAKRKMWRGGEYHSTCCDSLYTMTVSVTSIQPTVTVPGHATRSSFTGTRVYVARCEC